MHNEANVNGIELAHCKMATRKTSCYVLERGVREEGGEQIKSQQINKGWAIPGT